MNRVLALAALATAGVALAGCSDGPRSQTAYNNSGATAKAVAASPSTEPSQPPRPGDAPTPSTSTATPDSTSPNAPSTASLGATAKTATGAVAETVTTGKIKAAIASDAGMKDSDVSVSTNNGVVTLSGTVKSQDQVTIATNLAQRQEGVARVDSQIQVR